MPFSRPSAPTGPGLSASTHVSLLLSTISAFSSIVGQIWLVLVVFLAISPMEDLRPTRSFLQLMANMHPRGSWSGKVSLY